MRAIERQITQQRLLDDAVELHRRGSLDAAQSRYKAMLDDNPDDPTVLDLLSTLCRQREDHDAALKLSRRASSISPESWLYTFNLGECCRANSLFDEAIGAYQRSLKLRNDLSAIYLGLGQAFIEK